ncbi:carbohydrate binding family 9 domain-containing protein [Neolewinella aurantiaca]|uniref:Carbohydrate binding family 9 domain-containing protein n=1 Tax=Neolewinella aurantiaca TaxID=2602767 RepID=A0A5C7FEN0_9BACT|nr:DUF5916 domain-containing protein [Neolewinella aurantiaca]TXF88705.1 carbohydrate binding family 9 domain-containing protein [Neolewinella aurantiaca]
MRLTLILIAMFPILLSAQLNSGDPTIAPSSTAVRIPNGITLDGNPDESVWKASKPATGFWETFPSDTSLAQDQTEIYFGYDDDNLYVAAKCYVRGKDFVIPSLRRDYSAGGNDNLTFLFNPFKDKTNAIVFGMNPLGVTREALIYNGGESGGDFRDEWDNKWRGESYIGDNYWSAELIIPFTSLRFPDGDPQWYFNSYRFDTQSNTRSTWHHIPQNQIIMSLAYMGTIDFIGGAPKARGGNLTVIPYVGGNFVKDYEAGTQVQWDGDVGGDAKVGIGSGLNLDLTVNPDFSQVEVDAQVINTTRFEVFFPERRQFFLENADLFSSFGFEDTNPFFSRRIGVTRDTTTGVAIQNPIYYGARLSGKANDDYRIGLLNMQTAPNFDQGLPSYNYTVAATQRKVGARSALGGIFVNKQNFGKFTDSTETNSNFNRVAGIDFNLATKDNKWNGKTFLHRSFSDKDNGDDYVHGLSLEFRERHWNVGYTHAYVGEEYKAEVGFVPRKGFFTAAVEAERIDYPDNPNVVQKGPSIEVRAFSQPGDGITDYNYDISYGWQYANTRRLSFGAGFQNIYLFDAFDPTRTSATPLPGRRDYGYWRVGVDYESDERKKFSSSFGADVGEFFNGYSYGVGGGLVYRYQPFGAINLRFNYQYIDLPEPYASTALFLVGPRIDLTFSKSVFLTTFLQYNEQLNNFNLNARLQWRFAPVSDFFLVYTDNYDTLGWTARNRSLVAKATYWLNI